MIEFDNHQDLIQAESILLKVKAKNGINIFEEVDNRGDDLYVTLTYADNIENHFSIFLDEKEYQDFSNDVVFVAIKNGHHDTLGYYLDSDRQPNELENNLPLKKLFGFIMSHFKL